jgi:hypothetical protein
VPLVLSSTFLLAAEGPDQSDLPKNLAIGEPVTMTDSDEAYVSANLQRFTQADLRTWILTADAAYGLTDRWRVYAELPYAWIQPVDASSESGIGDVETSIRYSAVDYRKKPFGVDLGLGVTWPTGDESRGLGDGRARLVPSLIASQWLGPVNVELHVAWSHAWSDSGEEHPDVWQHDIAVIYPVRVGYLVLEGNGETTRGRTSYYVTPEFVGKATEHIQWLVGVPLGVTAAAADYGLVAGFTIELEHLFHRHGASD